MEVWRSKRCGEVTERLLKKAYHRRTGLSLVLSAHLKFAVLKLK